ncbi:hypothetical protein QYF61_005325 [Mycteria americana]|uniref:Uncharacterized protein n=1 Tax=Mycteria americana TaxID=33587 RepID=A0AAN7RPE5_MYCAM|nr:hypothetical protein QYF61_005325 [Mycteria americana]
MPHTPPAAILLNLKGELLPVAYGDEFHTWILGLVLHQDSPGRGLAKVSSFTLLSYLRTPFTASALRFCSASTSPSSSRTCNEKPIVGASLCQLLSFIQTVLQVLHRLVQVLLHPLQPQGFIPAPDLSIQGALHGLHDSEVVSLHLVNLLIFLCYFPVNLRLHLIELKLEAQDLPLFVFQGGLDKNKLEYFLSICSVRSEISSVGTKTNGMVRHRAEWEGPCHNKGGTFGIDGFDVFLCILQALGQLLPGSLPRIPHILGLLQLLRALNSVRLVFGSPLGHFAVGLGQGTLQLPLGFLLLLILFPEQVTVMASRLQGVVNLLPKLGCAVCVLLPQGGSRGFVLQRGLFKVTTHLLEFCLTLLVHINLSCDSALFSKGLILKNSFIQGQCLTFMNARMLYWMQKMDSLKDLEASNVQDTNEVLSGLLRIQLLVDANNHPQEHLLKDSLCQGTHCIVYLKKNHPGCITLFEVVQHSGFVEVGHHGHVLDFIILGRVHGEDLIFLHEAKRNGFVQSDEEEAKGTSWQDLQLSDIMRKSGHKLEHGKYRLDIRKIIFTMRVVQGRNRLSREAPSVGYEQGMLEGSVCPGDP